MTKTSFAIVPLDSAIADAARRDAAHAAPAHAIVTTEAPNAFPCRHCLRFADPGERVVLFNHAAIPPGHAYSENGAIFVHLEPCERYSPTSEYPPQLRHGRAMRAYDANFEIIDAQVVNGAPPEAVIEKFFANPETAFVDARSVDRGCFTFRVTRS